MCTCLFSDEDWDLVFQRFQNCQYIFDNFDKHQKDEKKERMMKEKRLGFEKRRNKVYMRNYLRNFYKKLQLKISTNNDLYKFVNEMTIVFGNFEDTNLLQFIICTKNIQTLTDLLNVEGLYHLKIKKFLFDGRI